MACGRSWRESVKQEIAKCNISITFGNVLERVLADISEVLRAQCPRECTSVGAHGVSQDGHAAADRRVVHNTTGVQGVSLELLTFIVHLRNGRCIKSRPQPSIGRREAGRIRY